jgi:hypothetical protein
MTGEQSKQLKVGTRVCFNGEAADHGTVKATNWKYITIAWHDGHTSFQAHSDMSRVNLVAPIKLKAK